MNAKMFIQIFLPELHVRANNNKITVYCILFCTQVFFVVLTNADGAFAATSAGPPTHGVDPKDSPGRAVLDFYGNSSAASAIPVVESVHGTVDAESPFIGINFSV